MAKYSSVQEALEQIEGALHLDRKDPDAMAYVREHIQKLALQISVAEWIPRLDLHTNNGDLRHDSEYRLGWNECRERFGLSSFWQAQPVAFWDDVCKGAFAAHRDVKLRNQAPLYDRPTPFEPVFEELKRACAKFPTWPTDPLHALGILHEEVGELSQAVLQATYEPEKQSGDAVREEAVQVAAMALRFLMHLPRYEYRPSDEQHQEVVV